MGHPGVSSTQWSLHTRWAGPGVRTQRQHRPVLIFFLFFSRNCSAPALGAAVWARPRAALSPQGPSAGTGSPTRPPAALQLGTLEP